MKIVVIRRSQMGVAGGFNTTLINTIPELEKLGHQLLPFEIGDKKDTYSSIRKQFADFYEETEPDAIHIVSEKLKGRAVRNYCVSKKIPFTTSFINNHEVAMARRYPYVPKWLVWTYLRWFHRPSKRIHVITPRLKNLLLSKRFKPEIIHYARGVNFQDFYYDPKAKSLSDLPRPFFMTMSRIHPDKNLEAFLELDLPGTKFVIGEGPSKKNLMKKWDKEVIFLPYDHLAEILSQGDVFVCPSIFETYGLVMIEAMACGLPVAAFPVMGPKDIIEQGVTGYMYSDLKKAALQCLTLKKQDCIDAVKEFTWEEHAKNFVSNLHPIPKRGR